MQLLEVVLWEQNLKYAIVSLIWLDIKTNIKDLMLLMNGTSVVHGME
jgi:hypothetical protein